MSVPKTILLVEDEALIALGEQQLLEQEGYQVVHAVNGETAIEIVNQNNPCIDLILMDIHLGNGMDGAQAAQKILATHAIPLIFLSSHTDQEVVEKTGQIASYGYIDKHSGPAILHASIKMAFKLYESEKRYRDLFENSTLAIFQSSREGKVISVNSMFARMFGYTSPQEVYQCVKDVTTDLFVDPSRRQDILQQQAENPDLRTFENLYRRKDGSAFWGRLNMRTITNAAGQVVSAEGFIEDITEQKRVADALRESEATLRLSQARAEAMLQAFPDLMFRLDQQGVYLDYKASLNELYIQSEGTIIGKRNRDLMPPAFADLIDQKLRDTLESGVLQTFEYHLPIPNAGMREYEARMVASGPSEVVTIVRDITERKQAEMALKESETRYRRLVECAPDIVYTFSSKRGGIYYSPRVEQVLGYTVEYLYAHPLLWNQSIHPEDIDRIVSVIQKSGSDIPFDIEYRIRNAQGRWVWLRDRSIDRQIRADEVLIEGLATDITERKQAEDQIKILLREKELLLKEVHHRVKNNLNTITSLLNLQAEVQESAAAHMALQDASSRVQSMMVLYDKLYRSHDFRGVSLQEYIPALLKEIIALFPYKDSVQLQTEIEEIVLAPRMLPPVGIILTELTTNAMKYAFPNHHNSLITVRAVQRPGKIAIEFEDNGIGMPAGYSVENSPGFGMQLVGILIQQLQGRITLECENGTRFRIEFEVDPV